MKLPDWITNPRKAANFHAFLTVLWLVMIPISVFTGLKQSIPFLMFLNLWGLVGSHWAAWQAARAEENDT